MMVRETLKADPLREKILNRLHLDPALHWMLKSIPYLNILPLPPSVRQNAANWTAETAEVMTPEMASAVQKAVLDVQQLFDLTPRPLGSSFLFA